MTQTATPPSPPKIPTGREIFDAIMGHIEVELTTEGLKTIAEKYKNETHEDLEARKKRYAAAFERYEQAYMGYMDVLHSQVLRFRKESFTQVEMEVKGKDQAALENLSQQFQTAV